MNWSEYEQHVAQLLRCEGWHARVVGGPSDGGVDIIAERDGQRMAVQVKQYGGGRPINAAMVRELHGAAGCVDCDQAMIATDARVLENARCAAQKLAITLRHVPVPTDTCAPSSTTDPVGFSVIWTEHVTALKGRTLARDNGSSNEILDVHGGGVVRRTSNDFERLIPIEVFRWAIERLLDGDTVTLREINEQYPGRGSSGVMLILRALPMFEQATVGGLQAIRLRDATTNRNEAITVA